jgi:hypothetical protein
MTESTHSSKAAQRAKGAVFGKERKKEKEKRQEAAPRPRPWCMVSGVTWCLVSGAQRRLVGDKPQSHRTRCRPTPHLWPTCPPPPSPQPPGPPPPAPPAHGPRPTAGPPRTPASALGSTADPVASCQLPAAASYQLLPLGARWATRRWGCGVGFRPKKCLLE